MLLTWAAPALAAGNALTFDFVNSTQHQLTVRAYWATTGHFAQGMAPKVGRVYNAMDDMGTWRTVSDTDGGTNGGAVVFSVKPLGQESYSSITVTWTMHPDGTVDRKLASTGPYVFNEQGLVPQPDKQHMRWWAQIMDE